MIDLQGRRLWGFQADLGMKLLSAAGELVGISQHDRDPFFEVWRRHGSAHELWVPPALEATQTRGFAAAPDASALVAGTPNGLLLWDPRVPGEGRLIELGVGVRVAAVAPGGRSLVAVLDDGALAHIALPGGKLRRFRDGITEPYRIELSSDASLALVTGNDAIAAFDVAAGARLWRLSHEEDDEDDHRLDDDRVAALYPIPAWLHEATCGWPCPRVDRSCCTTRAPGGVSPTSACRCASRAGWAGVPGVSSWCWIAKPPRPCGRSIDQESSSAPAPRFTRSPWTSVEASP